jgi:hypothetical protein
MPLGHTETGGSGVVVPKNFLKVLQKRATSCISGSLAMSQPEKVESNGADGGVQWTIENPKPKPWHLSAIIMAANGASQATIARVHGADAKTVSNLFHQRWFTSRVEEIMNENHKSVAELFKAERIASLATLVELRDSAMSEAVRASCALAIIERTMGKPGVQVPEEEPAFSGDVNEEVARINAELDRSYKERHRLRGEGQVSE